eukprot:scaffold65150_cov67-Phaeocystis_antarctica.AAC.13
MRDERAARWPKPLWRLLQRGDHWAQAVQPPHQQRAQPRLHARLPPKPCAALDCLVRHRGRWQATCKVVGGPRRGQSCAPGSQSTGPLEEAARGPPACSRRHATCRTATAGPAPRPGPLLLSPTTRGVTNFLIAAPRLPGRAALLGRTTRALGQSARPLG